MPRRRYQPPSNDNPFEETLPLDTVCTILTRQSTSAQSERNMYSDEVNPKDLILMAQRLGFPIGQIQVLDWDMGIGAYNTTIEDRPALHHWLTELLPTGQSRVVMVSQEDRLFRDRTEIQLNRFIEDVARYRGWVVCGQRPPYNFRRDNDCELFRMACKAGRHYIEFHVKRRLHPANQRSAMQGRYSGGPIPWGYIVDYSPKSETFKHFIPYQPHAALVTEQVFRRFASMAQPSCTRLALGWHRDGLLWPFLDAEVDDRMQHWFSRHRSKSRELAGYPFNRDQANAILTNVAYLGWVVRAGEIAMDGTGQPKICHQPLVDADLFWWCCDHLMPTDQRPPWAPKRQNSVMMSYRPHRARQLQFDDVRFLAAGKVRCAVHGRHMIVNTTGGSHPYDLLRCNLDDTNRFDGVPYCHTVSAEVVESALCRSFVEQLVLDEGDVHSLARLAQQRLRREDSAIGQLQKRLVQQRLIFENAKKATLQAPDLAADYLDDVRQAKQGIRELERQLAELQHEDIPSLQAWASAQRALGWAERIRGTFGDWSRQAKARVLSLALHDAVLGSMTRRLMGLHMQWEGGTASFSQIMRRVGRKLDWTGEENEALITYFHLLTWDALEKMLSARSAGAIHKQAYKLGLSRPAQGDFLTVPPIVVHGPTISNEMAAFGYELAPVTNVVSASCSTQPRQLAIR